MLDRYDSHDTTHVTYQRYGPDGTQVLALVAVAAVAVAVAMWMLAAMIWAVMVGVVSVAGIGGAVLINRDVQKTRQAREYRIVEVTARQAAGFPLDAPYYGRPPTVVDATPGRAALPAGQTFVNGRPRAASASRASRR